MSSQQNTDQLDTEALCVPRLCFEHSEPFCILCGDIAPAGKQHGHYAHNNNSQLSNRPDFSGSVFNLHAERNAR